ncbi:MAG: YtxH domain-containing protein [Thermomicrobiales bacterium]
MTGRFRAAAKFFTVGLVLGIMFAPESGENMRQRIIDYLRSMLPGSNSGE